MPLPPADDPAAASAGPAPVDPTSAAPAAAEPSQVTLRSEIELVRTVARLGRGPLAVLLALGGFLFLSSLYIAWFGTRFGVLMTPIGACMLLAAWFVHRRVRRGREAARSGRPLLAVDAAGVTVGEMPRIAWTDIDRLELTLHRDVPLDDLPEGTRRTVANAGGNRGTWVLRRRDGRSLQGRFDFVPSPPLHTFLVQGARWARAQDALLLHTRED